jgi:hypothetical protein
VTRERTPMTRTIIERLPKLRMIASTATGNASIDLKAAEERGVQVVHTGYTDDRTDLGTYSGQCPAISSPRTRRCTAAAGSSRSVMTWPGRRLESWASATSAVRWPRSATGMKVIAWSQNLTTERAAEVGATLVPKDELFQEADVVSIHHHAAGSALTGFGSEQSAKRH